MLNGWSSTLGKLPRWSPEVPGYTQDGPRAQSSRVQGTVEILTLLSAEAQSEFLPSFCSLCALPHHHLRRLRSCDLHTWEGEVGVSCRTEGVCQDSCPLFALLGLPWAKFLLRRPTASCREHLLGSERRRAVGVSEHGVE